MTSMLDKHEWWGRLLPYLLSGLADDGPAPRDEVLADVDLSRVCGSHVGATAFSPQELQNASGNMPICTLALATLNTLGAEHEVEHMDKLIASVQAGVDGDADGAQIAFAYV
jgi:hypothetical protein